ncbi:MAG: 2-oxoglutarate and iron-dependent oxygenase domain-containing protein, partial [Povalibacter sp.]
MSPQPKLPIIDVSDFDVDESRRARVTQSVNQALQESGFMYVVGHGLDPLLIAAAFAELRKFFAQPTE